MDNKIIPNLSDIPKLTIEDWKKFKPIARLILYCEEHFWHTYDSSSPTCGSYNPVDQYIIKKLFADAKKEYIGLVEPLRKA